MSIAEQEKQIDRTGPPASEHRALPVWLRCAISLLLCVHLAAVFIPPFTFASTGPNGTAPTAAYLMACLRPYIDFAYLNHGYFFFAPNPGASHLVEYEIMPAGDEAAITARFPDLQRHWPRLLYHRHFMLAEALNMNYAPPQPPPEIAGDPNRVAQWRRDRGIYEALWNSYETHLAACSSNDRVTIRRIEHRPPDLFEFHQLKMRLDDQRLYSILPEDGSQDLNR